jgi:hypothetical protein
VLGLRLEGRRSRRDLKRGGAGKIDWDAFLAEIVDASGYAWSFAEVEELTFPKLAALRKRLLEHPPAHWLMAWFLKYKPPLAAIETAAAPSAAPERRGGHSIAELKARFPHGVMKAGM